jgi:agmatinase
LTDLREQHDNRFLHVRPSVSFLDSETGFSEAKFVVVGAPLDVTGTFRTGYRGAPLAIRAASAQIETYSHRYSFDAESATVHDLGDITVGFDVPSAVRFIEETVAQIRSHQKIPIILGGEHTVTLGSFLGSGADRLVVFDAHMDLREEYQGVTLSHATWLRRLSERISPSRILIVGARATSHDELASVPLGINIIHSDDLQSKENEFVDWVENARDCYMSLDLDYFDPAYAPGVGNPEPGGSSPDDFFRLLSRLRRPRIVGLDVCEAIPGLDPSGITSVLATKVVVELLSLISVKDLTE